MYKKTSASIIMVICMMLVVSAHPVDSSAITRNKGFSTSDYWDYTNKTMHFETGDPYDGYDIWTWEAVGGVQGPSDGKYYIDTDTNTYKQHFGYDEFSTQNDIMAQVLFRPTQLTGAYRFNPIIYSYENTSLVSSDYWALAIYWYPNNLYLYHNTGIGEGVTPVLLASVSPVVNHEYNILLANSGNNTWVRIYDHETSSVVYNGTTTTFNYDATVLYAGFGQQNAGDGNVYGSWDNFTIVDSSLYVPEIDEGVLWGLDVSLIILGLVMIPVSMLYLAYGVKHDRSSDRLFYGIIIFMLGCGLFIGGILP